MWDVPVHIPGGCTCTYTWGTYLYIHEYVRYLGWILILTDCLYEVEIFVSGINQDTAKRKSVNDRKIFQIVDSAGKIFL